MNVTTRPPWVCGAKYIAKKLPGLDNYRHIAVRPPEMTEEEWGDIADFIVDACNQASAATDI